MSKIFLKILILFSLLSISLAIYFKPISNRYNFKEVEEGYIITDTATGKIYHYIVFPPAKWAKRVDIYDVVNNKSYLKLIPKQIEFLNKEQ